MHRSATAPSASARASERPAAPIRVRRQSCEISYPIKSVPAFCSLAKQLIASVCNANWFLTKALICCCNLKQACCVSSPCSLSVSAPCSSVCAGPSMLVRQHAGGPAPAFQQQQQSQLPKHLHQCNCFSAPLRRQQLAASRRLRQHRTWPRTFHCSAVAAPPEEVDTVEGPSLESATSGRRAVTAPAFPFVRIAGQTDMRLALLLNVIDPRIGGVLIMGDRGTGKSVAVSDAWTYLRSWHLCASYGIGMRAVYNTHCGACSHTMMLKCPDDVRQVRAMVEMLPKIEVVADDAFNSDPADPKNMGPDSRQRHAAGEKLPTAHVPTPLVGAVGRGCPLGRLRRAQCYRVNPPRTSRHGFRPTAASSCA